MADEIGGPISSPKPAQASEMTKEEQQQYLHQQAVKAGVFDLAGVGPAMAVKDVGKFILNPRTVNDFKTLAQRLSSNPSATKEQMKNLLLHAESWGHNIDKFRTAAGRLFPWN